MTATSIRLFQNEDTGKIVQLLNENAEHLQTKTRTTIEEFNQFLDEPGEEIRENTFVGWNGEQVIAYQSLCFVRSDDYINVYSYGAVHHQHRRKGIGSLLLKNTLKYLNQRAAQEKKKIIYNQMVTVNQAGQNELAEKFGLEKNTDLYSYKWTKSNSAPKQPILPNGYHFFTPTHRDDKDWAKIDNEAFSWRKNKDGMNPENVIYEFNSLEFSPDYYILCRNEKNDPIGFVCGREEEPQHAVISTLAVRPSYQGQGIGKALLHEVIRRMAAHNIQQIRLSVDANNPTSAISLYEKSGFTMDNRIIHYYYEIDPMKEVL